MGRWSALVARELIAWLALPAGSSWLDVGCGTGAVTLSILEGAAPAGVTGIDLSEAYLEYARSRIQDERVRFKAGDAQALPVKPAAYDAAVSALMLNFLPQPGRAVREMSRAARLGGTVAACVWDYAGDMQFLRYFWDAACALDPAACHLDEGWRFAICQPEPLADLFHSAGLVKIESRAIDIPTLFRNFEDYWTPFLSGQGPAPGYVLGLAEAQRAALRERLRQVLPFAMDGTLTLNARAWAVKGLV